MNPEAQAAFERMLNRMTKIQRENYLQQIEEREEEMIDEEYMFDRGETTHHIVFSEEPATEVDRDTVGGMPFLSPKFSIPHCQKCEEEMALCFQFDIRESFNCPFPEGCHLLAFRCVRHDEQHLYGTHEKPLPYRMWNPYSKSLKFLLLPPGQSDQPTRIDPYLVPKQLFFYEATECIFRSHIDGMYGRVFNFHDPFDFTFQEKVGGLGYIDFISSIAWNEDKNKHRCSCGAGLRFLCSISLRREFELLPHLSRPNLRLAAQDFGGMNLFACEKYCSPHAVIGVVSAPMGEYEAH
ncbi:Hypothetical protein PBC10988_33560 [Planctomycetales bacterium 10988]|nr:Hypothetical protein PBC10988_33560 [Planctomycetales bacterium 10988]